MFPFSQSINPALRSHLDSQFVFFNDLSRSLSEAFQSVCAANLKLSQNMIEETLDTSQRMFSSGDNSNTLGTVMSGAQSASEHLHIYRQHLSHLATGAQMDLARVTQQHGQETSRTARVLADEVTRVAHEEAEGRRRQQEELLKNFCDLFQQASKPRGNGMVGATAGAADAPDNKETSMQPGPHHAKAIDPQ